MVYNVYALRDLVRACYTENTLFIALTHAEAVRMVKAAKLPYIEDCQLYYLGEFNLEKGLTEAVPQLIKSFAPEVDNHE